MTGSGVYILNEGNFMGGNGSLSFYSYDSAKIYNDLFYNVNGRPLGDVPNSIVVNDPYAYVVINNSGKIEVIDKVTLESVKTISGLISPRNMAFVTSKKGYVTSMYSDSVTVINLAENSISGYINIRRSSESVVISGSMAYISNWVGGDEIIIINTSDNKVVDSIGVGIEPESMVLDKNKRLWVLCNGGWMRENYARLIAINTITNQIDKEFVFPSIQDSPSSLRISGNGEDLFYLDGGVRKMNIGASALPSAPFIRESGNYFYKFDVNPLNGDVFVTDAVDYQQKGFVFIYDDNGTLISEEEAGIIPGQMCFKINDNFTYR